jgi:hypothetical protein
MFVYRNAFDPKVKLKVPPKHPFNVRIWNRLKKIKQALFRRLIPSLASSKEIESKGKRRMTKSVK